VSIHEAHSFQEDVKGEANDTLYLDTLLQERVGGGRRVESPLKLEVVGSFYDAFFDGGRIGKPAWHICLDTCSLRRDVRTRRRGKIEGSIDQHMSKEVEMSHTCYIENSVFHSFVGI